VAQAAQVGDLGPGDHACLTFSDGEERLDLVAAFVREALRSHRRVLCLTDTLSEADLAGQLGDRGLDVDQVTGSGQLTLLSTGATFLADGAFTPTRVIELVSTHIRSAHDDGFAGLWITHDMGWAVRPVAGLEHLWDFESRMSRLLSDTHASAVCQYDRQEFDTVTLAHVAATHGRAVAAVTYFDDPLLRICRQYQPPGVRVSGEIDYRRAEPLAQAMSEALGLDSHVHLNLTGLSFMDGSAAGVLMQAGAALGDDQRLTVRCRRQSGKVLHSLGLPELPRVEVVVIDDD
jgi:anti-anti-sigma factor